MPEGNFVKDPAKAEIEKLQERYENGRWWTRQFLYAFLVLIAVAVFSPIEGAAFIAMYGFGLAMMLLHFVSDIRDKGRKVKITQKINAYQRQKALPAYDQLRKELGSNYSVRMAEDGAIVVGEKVAINVRPTEKHDDQQEDQNRQN